MEEHVAAFLASQHGTCTRRQLRECCGLTDRQISRLVERGRITRVAHAVYSAPGVPRTPEFEAMVALLRCGPGARLIGPRVLHWLGLRKMRRDADFGVLVRDVGRRRRLEIEGIDFLVARDPCPTDRSSTTGAFVIPAPPRLMVEMTRFAAGGSLTDAIDAGRWDSRPSIRQLHDCVLALPENYQPAAEMRAVLEAHDAFHLESEAERLLRKALGPLAREFTWQHHVTPRIRVDAYHPRGIVLEYDGREDHDSVTARLRDAARDAVLAALGIRVIHLTAADLRQPAALRRRIAALIAA